MSLEADLVGRYEALSSSRKTVEQMWEAITEFIMPYRGEFFDSTNDETSIDWFRHRDVYDSTAVMAHQTLAASLHGALTSPSTRWFNLRFRDEKLNKKRDAKRWLEESAQKVFFSLQDSNFNLEVNEAYQDVAGFGIAFLSEEEADGQRNQWNGLDFSSIPIKEGYFEPDHKGRVHRFFRCLKWTPSQIIAKFGREGVPQSIRDKDEHGQQERLQVLWCVYPRNNRTVALGEKVAPSRRPIEACYILSATKERLGEKQGYYEMPIFAPRWRKTSDSIWGNSPAMTSLADVLTLNEARKMQLVASEKLIDPPIFAEERSIIADLDLSAASLSVVRNIEGIQAFNTTGQISISDLMVQQLQAAVRNYFFMDQLTFPDPQAQPMTATEAQIRYEQMQRLLGPTMGRLQSDMLDPIVSRTMRMLARDGVLESPPPEVIESNAELDIEYMGSLVRAQNSDAAVSIERWAMTLANLSQVFPEIIDVADDDKMARQLGRDLNVPADLMRDAAEVMRKHQEQQEQQQQAMQAQLAQEQGQGMQAVAEGQRAMQEAENAGGQ